MAFVWVTGGAASNYQDMFLIVPLVSALTLSTSAFTASVVVAVLGAFAPLVYERPGPDFLADSVADAAVWVGAAAVAFVQVQRRRRQSYHATRVETEAAGDQPQDDPASSSGTPPDSSSV